jgi:hypothetical protein
MHEQIPFPLTTKTRPRHGDVSDSEGQYVATFAAVQHRLDGASLASVGGRAEGEPRDVVVAVRVVVPLLVLPGGNRMTSPAPTVAEESGRSATSKVASPDWTQNTSSWSWCV